MSANKDNKIAVLDSGAGYHLASLYGEFNKYFHKTLYLPDLTWLDLQDCDILIVPCVSSQEQLINKKQIIYKFLNSGKTLVVTGRNAPELWLEGIEQVDLPFNFWWWLDPNNQIDIQPVDLDYGLFKYDEFKNLVWHYHDGYKLPEGATNVIEHKSIPASIYFDLKNYMGGRLILTSLDPFFHTGQFFMPNAQKFLRAFLPFLTKEI